MTNEVNIEFSDINLLYHALGYIFLYVLSPGILILLPFILKKLLDRNTRSFQSEYIKPELRRSKA